MDEENPRKQSVIKLGYMLFFDPRISSSGSLSCASCHNPALGWEDGLALGHGHGMKKLPRHTPTILNLGYSEAEAFFWDGRAESLEAQALGPIEAAGEMNMPLDQMVRTLESIKGYDVLFKQAFGDGKVTKEQVGKALADYQRTIVSKDAPFDLWLKGDKNAIGESAKRGFVLFNEKANCAVCHSGWRFTDDGFHNIGIGDDDVGRAKVLDFEILRHAFKTPTLRNIDLRAPYFHDGSAATLEDVIELYDKGGNKDSPSLSSEVRQLNLTGREKKDLVNFLKTLTSKDNGIVIPTLPKK